MLKWVGIFVISTLGGLALYLFLYLGAYKEVVARVEIYPTLHLVYRDHTGAYHKIGEVLQEMETQAKKLGLNCSKTFGRFLDDPQTTDPDRLRSQVGCVLETSIANQKLQQMDAKYLEIPSQKYIYGRFQGSPAISPFVVYPELLKLAEENRLSTKAKNIEIYEIDRDQQVTTEYLLPLESPTLSDDAH